MLRITQTYAKIGMEISNSQLIMRSKPLQLKIHRQDTRMVIHSEKPRVIIDQSQCWKERGLKNPIDVVRESAQLGYKSVMSYISKKTEEGRELAAIEKGGNPLAEIAKRNFEIRKQFGMVTIPKSRPKIDVVGYLNIEWIPGKVQIEVEPAQLEIQATKPEIRYYLIQQPSVQIQYVGENIDLKL